MLLAAFMALLLALPQDSATVRAWLSTARVAAGAITVLSIEVANTGAAPADIPVPVLPPGLELGPISDFSELQVAFPGGRRRITRREIAIVAAAPGSYRIPSIQVRVAGRTLRTRALQLVVNPARADGRGRGQPPPVRLQARVVPAVAFVGQQVLYEVAAVFPEQLRLHQTRPPSFEPPVATGFWTYDLDDPITVTLRLSEGEPAEVQQFRQVLFPLSDGRLEIPPARVQYELRQGIISRPRLQSLASEPVAVVVQPLPPGAPAEFAGAVGSYALEAALSAVRAAPGEPVSLRITVEGSGNIKALPRPPLDSVPGLDVYPGAEQHQVGFAGGQVSGRKVFEWTVVPRTGGVFTIPGVQYAWFDPDLRTYRTATTPGLQLSVRGTPAASVATRRLAPLRLAPDRPLGGLVSSPWFGAAQLIPPLGLLVLWLGKRRARRMNRRPGTQLPAVVRPGTGALADPRRCLEELALWLGRCPDIPGSALLRQRVREALYSPLPPAEDRCRELVATARRLYATEPGSGATPGGLALLLALAVGSGAAAPTAFSRGVAAFQAGHYEAATNHFARHASGVPDDAAAWYNLGNAAFLAGEPGRAAWAWLKSLQLRPREPWPRQNLRAAGLPEAERALAPAVPVSTAEAAGLAALLWWLACAALGLALARASWRKRGSRSALAAVLLLLPLIGLLLVRGGPRDRALTVRDTWLQSAPSLRADALDRLPLGVPLVVLERRKEWLRVRSSDLRQGWVEKRSIGVL